MRSAGLAGALGLGPGDVVAFVGGGGKTSAIVRVAAELSAAGRRVVATTTTRVGWSIARHLRVEVVRDADEAVRASARAPSVFLSAGFGPDGKHLGVDPGIVDAVAAAGVADVVLVEADGSRQRPIKAPSAHEPVIPGSTTVLVPVVGLDALGREIDESTAHRPDRVVALTGAGPLTAEGIARLVLSHEGGLKGAPPGASIRPLLNKAKSAPAGAGASVASGILAQGASVERVVVSDIATSEFAFVLSGGR
jgi:probable selenium-dependent hydroxylase accessory protein YqeC